MTSELGIEVERLTQPQTEVMLNNRMLREVANNVTGGQQPAAADHLREAFGVS